MGACLSKTAATGDEENASQKEGTPEQRRTSFGSQDNVDSVIPDLPLPAGRETTTTTTTTTTTSRTIRSPFDTSPLKSEDSSSSSAAETQEEEDLSDYHGTQQQQSTAFAIAPPRNNNRSGSDNRKHVTMDDLGYESSLPIQSRSNKILDDEKQLQTKMEGDSTKRRFSLRQSLGFGGAADDDDDETPARRYSAAGVGRAAGGGGGGGGDGDDDRPTRRRMSLRQSLGLGAPPPQHSSSLFDDDQETEVTEEDNHKKEVKGLSVLTSFLSAGTKKSEKKKRRMSAEFSVDDDDDMISVEDDTKEQQRKQKQKQKQKQAHDRDNTTVDDELELNPFGVSFGEPLSPQGGLACISPFHDSFSVDPNAANDSISAFGTSESFDINTQSSTIMAVANPPPSSPLTPKALSPSLLRTSTLGSEDWESEIGDDDDHDDDNLASGDDDDDDDLIVTTSKAKSWDNAGVTTIPQAGDLSPQSLSNSHTFQNAIQDGEIVFDQFANEKNNHHDDSMSKNKSKNEFTMMENNHQNWDIDDDQSLQLGDIQPSPARAKPSNAGKGIDLFFAKTQPQNDFLPFASAATGPQKKSALGGLVMDEPEAELGDFGESVVWDDESPHNSAEASPFAPMIHHAQPQQPQQQQQHDHQQQQQQQQQRNSKDGRLSLTMLDVQKRVNPTQDDDMMSQAGKLIVWDDSEDEVNKKAAIFRKNSTNKNEKKQGNGEDVTLGSVQDDGDESEELDFGFDDSKNADEASQPQNSSHHQRSGAGKRRSHRHKKKSRRSKSKGGSSVVSGEGTTEDEEFWAPPKSHRRKSKKGKRKTSSVCSFVDDDDYSASTEEIDVNRRRISRQKRRTKTDESSVTQGEETVTNDDVKTDKEKTSDTSSKDDTIKEKKGKKVIRRANSTGIVMDKLKATDGTANNESKEGPKEESSAAAAKKKKSIRRANSTNAAVATSSNPNKKAIKRATSFGTEKDTNMKKITERKRDKRRVSEKLRASDVGPLMPPTPMTIDEESENHKDETLSDPDGIVKEGGNAVQSKPDDSNDSQKHSADDNQSASDEKCSVPPEKDEPSSKSPKSSTEAKKKGESSNGLGRRKSGDGATTKGRRRRSVSSLELPPKKPQSKEGKHRSNSMGISFSADSKTGSKSRSRSPSAQKLNKSVTGLPTIRSSTKTTKTNSPRPRTKSPPRQRQDPEGDTTRTDPRPPVDQQRQVKSTKRAGRGGARGSRNVRSISPGALQPGGKKKRPASVDRVKAPMRKSVGDDGKGGETGVRGKNRRRTRRSSMSEVHLGSTDESGPPQLGNDKGGGEDSDKESPYDDKDLPNRRSRATGSESDDKESRPNRRSNRQSISSGKGSTKSNGKSDATSRSDQARKARSRSPRMLRARSRSKESVIPLVKKVDPAVLKQQLRDLLNFDPNSYETDFSDESFITFVEQHPNVCADEIQFAYFEGPIHALSMLCALSASLDSIRACCENYPDAIHDKDAWVGTPLHYAALYGTPPEVLEYIIDIKPDLLNEVNFSSQTVLHSLFNSRRNRHFEAIARALLDRNPGLASIADGENQLPHHLACDFDAPMSVLERLVKCDKSGLQSQNGEGMTPLHCAVRADISISKMKLLIKVFPKALKIQDEDGLTPLHLALMEHAEVTSVKLLYYVFPAAAEMKNNAGLTPPELARRVGAGSTVMELFQTKS